MGQHDRNGDVATEGSGQLADDTKGFDQVKIIFKLNQHQLRIGRTSELIPVGQKHVPNGQAAPTPRTAKKSGMPLGIESTWSRRESE